MRIVLLAIVVLVAACSAAAPAPDSPGAIVQQAVAKVAAKDVDGLRALACAGQEDAIAEQLGLAGLAGSGAEVVGAMDTDAVLAAVTLDVGDVRLGEAAIDGDSATVPVSGSVKVTFDEAAMRPILARMLAEQGRTMTDEEIDALLKSLASYGQDMPVDESIQLLRSGGAWRICQAPVQVPAGS